MSMRATTPITHKAGDVVAEIEISHWWKNLGDKTVVLLSTDLLRVGVRRL
jgi:quercetin dioxygenase-like cupin family protein